MDTAPPLHSAAWRPHLFALSESNVALAPPPLLKGGEGAGGGTVCSASAAKEIKDETCKEEVKGGAVSRPHHSLSLRDETNFNSPASPAGGVKRCPVDIEIRGRDGTFGISRKGKKVN